MHSWNDNHRGRKVERREVRLQALSTAEIARRAAVRSGTWLVPGQRDPGMRPLSPFVPRQRNTPPED